MKLKTDISNVKNYDGIPSITGILSLLEIDSLNYLKSLPNYDKIMKEASVRGTYIHKYIEQELEGKTPRLVKKHLDFVKQWIIYKFSTNATDTSGVELEKFIKNDKVAGTIDYIKTETIGVKIIRDWKTSASGNLNIELLEKYKLQIGGYSSLLGASHMVGEIVIFSPKGFNIIKMNDDEVYKYRNSFNALRDYYYSIKNGTPPSYVSLHTGDIEVMGEQEITPNRIYSDLVQPIEEVVIESGSPRLTDAWASMQQAVDNSLETRNTDIDIPLF